MKNIHFGDEKDRVKWTSLLNLAQREDIQRIIQVAMLTDDVLPPPRVAQQLQGNHQDVPALVTQFFDAYGHPRGGLRDITVLGDHFYIFIDPWVDDVFTHPRREREAYFDWIAERIQELHPPTIWFFDPDNGIEPATATRKHVRQIELRQVFDALPLGHFLAVFQYSQRQTDAKWRETNRDRFRRACGIPLNYMDRVQVLEWPAASPNAVIRAVQKL